jgi:superfamily II DNA helicase RecQ
VKWGQKPVFRTNGSPLMVATKVFGMGIDKPCSIYCNMNYSSPLESFVQEVEELKRQENCVIYHIT